VLTFGRDARADVCLSIRACDLGGSTGVLETPLGELPVRTTLLGDHNLDNVAAAAACAIALGLTAEAIGAGTLALGAVPGRAERVDRGQPFTVIVDYAHTEQALGRLLAWLKRACRGRVIVVFGCGGQRDPGKRPAMGRVAAEAADRIFVTSDNPRHEDPLRIIDDIVAGAAEIPGAIERLRKVPEREHAIRDAIAEARADDAVVVAGKGHEDRQTIGDVDRPFDDRAVVAAALESLGWRGGPVADA
jgi:UDP-N-acetylmuramoyl-L-alanyl-D-glutamate--2,6-diaminopimelate ligase